MNNLIKYILAIVIAGTLLVTLIFVYQNEINYQAHQKNARIIKIELCKDNPVTYFVLEDGQAGSVDGLYGLPGEIIGIDKALYIKGRFYKLHRLATIKNLTRAQ